MFFWQSAKYVRRRNINACLKTGGKDFFLSLQKNFCKRLSFSSDWKFYCSLNPFIHKSKTFFRKSLQKWKESFVTEGQCRKIALRNINLENKWTKFITAEYLILLLSSAITTRVLWHFVLMMPGTGGLTSFIS